MFWKFNYMSSDIDTVLDKEDVTLKEILDEDDVLQECKAQNKKLVDFLVQQKNFEELVNHVINEPPTDMEERARYKYANIACELITSDVNQITEALATTSSLLDNVINYLDTENQLNTLQASFFSKVIGLLITRKSELILERMKSKENFLSRVLHHIGTSAVMDLLLRLLTSMESVEARPACVQWLLQEKIVNRLIDLLEASNDADVCCNASQSLCDMIRLSREQLDGQSCDQNHLAPLLSVLEDKETVGRVLNVILSGQTYSEASLINGIYVLQTLIEFRRIGPEGFLDQPVSVLLEDGVNTDSTSSDCTDAKKLNGNGNITKIVEALVPRLKDFHHILLNPPKQYYQPMPTTCGLLNQPLGNTRLQIVHLIASAISTNTQAFNAELARLNTLNVLLDLYFEYSWNNFLHCQVERCIQLIVTVENSSDRLLLTQLINETPLLEKIMKAFKSADETPPGHLPPPVGVTGAGCCRRLGFMGHLTRIANGLAGNNGVKGSNYEKIEQLLKSLSAETQENWYKFLAGSLAEVNKLNVTEMLSSGPSICSVGGDDDDFNIQIPFSQDNSSATTHKFGINEDEFNDDDDTRLQFDKTEPFSLSPTSGACDNASAEEMFERLCSARDQLMRNSGSAGVEEDVWVEKELTLSDEAIATSSPAATTARTRQMPGAAGGRNSTHMALDSDDDSDDDERGGARGDVEGANSSDSEEDLDSPAMIRQTPDTSSKPAPTIISGTTSQSDSNHPFSGVGKETTAPAAEAMDTGDNWANFDDAVMDTLEAAPIRDEGATWASPSSGSHQSSSTTDDGSWANFDSFSPESASAKDSSTDSSGGGWVVDFSDLTNIPTSTDSELKDVTQAQPPVTDSSPLGTQSSTGQLSARAAAYAVPTSPDSKSTSKPAAAGESTNQ